MNVKIPNTSYRCKCGKYQRLEYIDEVKTCSCGRKVEYPEEFKKYLTAVYIDHKKISNIKIEGLVIKPIKYIKID